MDESSEVARLLQEIRELQHASEPEPVIEDVRAPSGSGVFSVRFHSSQIERDEAGRIARIVSPVSVKTVIRNEEGRVMRIDTEDEELEEA